VLLGYSRQYPVEEFDVLTVDGKRLVELPFAVPLGTVTLPEPLTCNSLELPDNVDVAQWLATPPKDRVRGAIVARTLTEIPIMWTGLIDMVVKWRNAYWLLDHKTTSMMGPTYYEQFKLASQFNGYAYALQRALNLTVDGVIVNVLAIRKPTVKGTGKGTTFEKQGLPIRRDQIDEWQVNTLGLLGQFLTTLATGREPLMHNQACRTKWQRNCDYLGVCSMEKESRQTYLDTGDYRPVTWSPLNRD
jgi:hypothetical protein